MAQITVICFHLANESQNDSLNCSLPGSWPRTGAGAGLLSDYSRKGRLLKQNRANQGESGAKHVQIIVLWAYKVKV